MMNWTMNRPPASRWSSRFDAIGSKLKLELQQRPVMFVVIFFLTMPCANAQTPADQFDAANKLYEQGRYPDAAAAYEHLAQSGTASPALYFNLGNARFKSKQVGRAIVAYRLASELTPRDPDVRANLQFARNQVPGPTLRPSRWERWIGSLSVNEWTWLATGAAWLSFLLLAAMQVNPVLTPALRPYTAAFIGGAIVLCACLGLVLTTRLNLKTAVVVSANATVHSGPLEESQTTFVANDGAELHVLDQKDNWLQVTDGTRRIGWIQREKTRMLPNS